MLFRTISEGFFLGLSTGTICVTTCTPIYLPYLMGENRNLVKNLLKIFEISAGRFISYIAFGAMAGWLGTSISRIDRSLFTGIAYILLSVFLILTSVRIHRKEKACHISGILKFTKNAFILGLLTGINFCPSFLIALSKAIELAGILSGVMLFLGFFIGTTIFLIPLAFTGLLASIKKVKVVAKIAALLIGIWFIYQGSSNIYHYFHKENARIVDPSAKQQEMILVSSPADSVYYRELADSLANFKQNKFSFYQVENISTDLINKLSPSGIILVDNEIYEKFLVDGLESRDMMKIETGYPIRKIMPFLRKFTFKTAPGQGLRWEFWEHQPRMHE